MVARDKVDWAKRKAGFGEHCKSGTVQQKTKWYILILFNTKEMKATRWIEENFP